MMTSLRHQAGRFLLTFTVKREITQTQRNLIEIITDRLAVWSVSVVTDEEEPRPGLEEVWIIFKVLSCNKLSTRKVTSLA